MKYVALVILIFSLPCFAVEYNVGLAGAVGLGISLTMLVLEVMPHEHN